MATCVLLPGGAWQKSRSRRSTARWLFHQWEKIEGNQLIGVKHTEAKVVIHQSWRVGQYCIFITGSTERCQMTQYNLLWIHFGIYIDSQVETPESRISIILGAFNQCLDKCVLVYPCYYPHTSSGWVVSPIYIFLSFSTSPHVWCTPTPISLVHLSYSTTQGELK